MVETLKQAARAHALAHGVKPSLLLGIADHESRLDPYAKNPQSTAAGAWQFIRATAEGIEPGAYAAILSGDIETQARCAAKLYVQNRAATGSDDGAIAAWWVGPAGYRRVLSGEVLSYPAHPKIDLADVLAYVADVRRRADAFRYLDAAPIA